MGSSFDTKNVKNISSMLKDCENIEYLNLSTKDHHWTPNKTYFNTEKVKNMSKMFDGCKNLREIIVSSFDSDLNLSKFKTKILLTFPICLKIAKIEKFRIF